MNDWRLLGLALAFVYAMARLQNVNRRAMKFGGLLVLALAGYKTVPLLAPMLTSVPERAAPRVMDVDTALGEVGLESKFIGGAQSSARGTGDPRINIVPEAPSYDETKVLSPTGDSLRTTGGEYFGTRSLDSVHIQVDTIDGDWTSPRADVRQGAVVTDTLVLASDSGAVLKTRTRYRNAIGWSPWSDSVQVTMVYPVPSTPSVSSAVAVDTDSLRVVSTSFSSSGENDAHDSTHVQVETVTGDWSSPQFEVRLGAVLTDTATSLTADTTKARVRHHGRGGWSAWSDSVTVVMAGLPPNTPTISFSIPDDTTVVLVGSSYSGSGTHSESIYQVDTVDGDWTSLVALDTVDSGDLERDTITGLATDSHLKARVAYVNENGTSTFSDSTDFTVSGLHPNEPAGMTVICNGDGSVAEDVNGAFGCDGTGWGSESDNVTTVADGSNPTGSESYIQFVWDIDTGGGWECCITDVDLSPGYDTIYVAYREFMPNATARSKIFYLQSSNGGVPGANVWISHNKSDDFEISDQDGNPHWGCNNCLTNRQPNEHLIEVLFFHESSSGAKDGSVQAWIDGTKVVDRQGNFKMNDRSAGNYDVIFDNLHFYNKHNDNEPRNDTTGIRELYISGRE